MVKRGINFIFLFVFIIFLAGFVSSATCSVTSYPCTSPYPYVVMKLSSTTNAHGALYNQGTYTSALCCDFSGVNTCSGSNKVLGLSSTTNAHAEVPSGTSYSNPDNFVCFGNLTCTYSSGSCSTDFPISMVSLSSTTNAHIAQFSSYTYKICCAFPTPTSVCGNGTLEILYEECDDGNIINGDGCNSTCAVESGYTCNGLSPTCCQLITPTTSWKKNGVVFTGGNIVEGNILTMTFNEDFCFASGTSITFSIYEGATIRATATGTVTSDTPGTTSATYTVTSGFLTALGGTSNIFFRITNPRTLDSSTISVTPVMCDLTSATWNYSTPVGTSVVTGTPVRLNVGGTNCAGKIISFVVWEKDRYITNPDDLITDHGGTNPTNILSFTGTSSYITWNAFYMGDTDGIPLFKDENPPEYYFNASVVGYSESITSSNINVDDPAMLRVTQPVLCPNGVIDPGETCTTCIQDVPCGPGERCDAGTQTCVLDCILSNPVWNMTNAVGGQKVQASVQGTNCNGQSVSFEIREDDSPLGYDAVGTNPSPVTMNSGLANGTWTAEWPDVGGETAPEYYFVANVNVLGKTIESSRSSLDELHVTANLYCGDGIISNPNSVGFAETCDGTNFGTATCASVMEEGWTGTLECSDSCTFNTTACIPPCNLTSATWSSTIAAIGSSVRLNVQGTNCIGKNITFEIKEKDKYITNPDDDVLPEPPSIFYSSPNNYTTWNVIWQEDIDGIPLFKDENPPEYYFIASVVGTAESIESSNIDTTDPLLLTPIDLGVLCSGINYCSDYSESNCGADLCGAGIDSVPGTVSCGGSFNSETGCYDYTNCGCTWDDVSSVCESSWNEESSCGVCGNAIRDYPNEECDDGNNVNGDGCSSDCQFESGIENPCSEGLTLCNDGTCSLNCYSTDGGVASCNYDDVCQSGEGCTCIDCHLEEDTCSAGLICTIFNAACCSFVSDGVCSPYCSYIDPDCSLGATCGNGFKETGEECDLGIRNDVANSGCLSNCKLEIIDPTTNGGCPEGTALCNDGTCSLNCYYTDEGVNDADFTQCQAGLIWSIVDQACCNNVGDAYCNEYCAYTDPDCVSQSPGGDSFSIGTCSYTETSTDTCEDDNMLVRSLSALWTWDEDNSFSSNPDGLDYWQPDLPTNLIYRYDPLDYSGLRKSQKCDDINDILVCPASVQVPFEFVYGSIITIAIVALIYIIYFLRKKNNSKNKKK